MTDTKTYTLAVTDQQARLIRDACEFMSRAYMGQFDGIIELYNNNAHQRAQNGLPVNVEKTNAYRPMIRENLQTAEGYFLGSVLSGPYSMASCEMHDDARRLADMQDVLRHRLYLDEGGKPSGGLVSSYPPYHYQKDTPLIAIEKYDPGAEQGPNYPAPEIVTWPATIGATFTHTQPPISYEED